MYVIFPFKKRSEFHLETLQQLYYRAETHLSFFFICEPFNNLNLYFDFSLHCGVIIGFLLLQGRLMYRCVLHIKNGFVVGEEDTEPKKLGFLYFIHKNRFATIY